MKDLWRPQFHLAPQQGWMNDPNGFCFYNGRFHLFYQYNPLAPQWGNIHWGHAVSHDLYRWRHLKPALAPRQRYDRGGVFSGSAIEKDGELYLFYTGNAEGGCQTQNLATSKNGRQFRKFRGNPLLSSPPCCKGSGDHFRDPYVWEHDKKYYMLVGAQRAETADGQILMYRSDDLINWTFLNVAATGSNGEWGYMWECPSYVKIGEEEFLFCSPQGIKPQGQRFLNLYQCGYFKGKMNYERGVFEREEEFHELDFGFDFYAAQVRQMPDGRVWAVAWMDMWKSEMPETTFGWAGMMTLPRELKVQNGKLYSFPAEIIGKKSRKIRAQKIGGEKLLRGIKGESYLLKLRIDMSEAALLKLKLRVGKDAETIVVYDLPQQRLILNRDQAGEGPKGERQTDLELGNDDILNLQIVMDRSSVEIFAGEGEKVLSARIYPPRGANQVMVSAVGEARIIEGEFIQMS